MLVRAILGILLIFALLFMADQEFADGRYTRMAERTVVKIRAAIGI